MENKCSKKVMVVDDDRFIRESLKDFLSYEGYQTILAANGKEALDLLDSRDLPGLILLDLMMPVMNGWEFSKAVQTNETLKKIPVVIISAFADQGKILPAQAYLNKPFHLDELISHVKELCV